MYHRGQSRIKGLVRQNAWNENGQENVSFAMKSLHQACVLRMLYDETVKENTFLSRSHASISLDCSEITSFFGRNFWRVFENTYGLLHNLFIKEYIMLCIILSFTALENTEKIELETETRHVLVDKRHTKIL